MGLPKIINTLKTDRKAEKLRKQRMRIDLVTTFFIRAERLIFYLNVSIALLCINETLNDILTFGLQKILLQILGLNKNGTS